MKNIKNILFDCDGVLYQDLEAVFGQVSKKMTKYISNKLGIDLIKAKELQTNYFHKYNTSLNGLMIHHDIPPEEFLKYVHDIDLSFMKKDLVLRNELEKLNTKKFVFTNGSKEHVKNITEHLGIDDLFDGIFDIVDSKFVPKPSIEPYKNLIDKYNINPKLGVLVEDIARNLKPAYDLGMKTVWIENNEAWASKDSNENFVNFRTKNLSDFLKQVNMLKTDQ